ncbi:hypothetical protein CDG77_03170 [Nostoc sp. 'Peltigera membranacea cyanobiont' 213]|nr:hypothetical protein CDG77_03170 [Nostoc sp. 'Peltigera membranacea cyanobiont' 213]
MASKINKKEFRSQEPEYPFREASYRIQLCTTARTSVTRSLLAFPQGRVNEKTGLSPPPNFEFGGMQDPCGLTF